MLILLQELASNTALTFHSVYPLRDLCFLPSESKQVETAGDCYIAAGGLMMIDKDGFMCIDPAPDPKEAAERVLSFAKVRGTS